MTKLRNYQAWKLKKLNNPEFAAHYLNEIERSSPELILSAIQNVVRAREVSTVAKEAGVARENIYRAFTQQGNPTYATFREVLKAVGVKLDYAPIIATAHSPSPPPPSPTEGGLNSSHSPKSLTPSSLGKLQKSKGLLVSFNQRVDSTASKFANGIGQQRRPMGSEHGNEVRWNQEIR